MIDPDYSLHNNLPQRVIIFSPITGVGGGSTVEGHENGRLGDDDASEGPDFKPRTFGKRSEGRRPNTKLFQQGVQVHPVPYALEP